MKTIKSLFALLALTLVWQYGQAQCAAFNLWQQSPGSDTVVVYPYVSDVADSASATIAIDFGDGTTQAANGMAWHIYSSTGVHNICISYTSAQCTSIRCDSVYVQNCGGMTNLSVDQSTASGVTTLSINGAPGGSTYAWTLANGGSSSTSSSPTYSYPANATYYDHVIVTSPSGCSRYVYFTVNTMDSCNANWHKQQYGNDVTFIADQYAESATYTWTFGDGQTGTGVNTGHTYSGFGTYTACLKVTTAGCVDSVCQTVVTAQPNCPSADSLFRALPSANGVVTFNNVITDSSQLYGNPIITINYGDGQTGSFYHPQAHTYSTSGNYEVCVNYTNDYCNVTQCDTVAIDMCNVSSSIVTSLYGASIYYSLSDANPSWSYAWTFVGGTPSTSSNPSELVSYAVPGSYAASVTVSIPGCAGVDTFYTSVYASHDSCNANFTYGTSGLTAYLFVNDSLDLVNGSGIFHYGDGTSGTNTVHTYASGGTYNVTYSVSSAYCSDSITQAITVTGAPVTDSCSANFGYYINDLTVQIYPADPSHTVKISYAGYDTLSTTHTFATYGTYNICLVVSTGTCTDSVCKQITLTPPYVNITGTVSKQGAGAACDATVLLISDSAGYLSIVNTYTITDSLSCVGNYSFWAPQGTYYVKAKLDSTDPDYADYLPTYYGDELNWVDATAVNASSSVSSVDIALIAGVNPGGPGFIGGLVSQGAGLGVINDYEHRAVGDPIPNVQINLLTDNDVPVAYTYSDGSGMFAFNSIPLGSYKVHAEVINKIPVIETVTLTANNPSVNNISVEVNTSNAVTSINDIADLKLDGVFPNPVKDVAIIRFSAKQNTNATIQVSDMKGNVITTANTNIVTGNNEVKVNLANQAAGIYTLSITNSDNKKIVKLLKAE